MLNPRQSFHSCNLRRIIMHELRDEVFEARRKKKLTIRRQEADERLRILIILGLQYTKLTILANPLHLPCYQGL